MRIFVASWFYVPVTTSEALVTYKLLANSKHEYVVCSAKSNKWSYNKDSELTGDNIQQHIINTDNFDEFVDETVKLYFELSKTQKFDAIMTRSLPPESQYVGFKIKEIDKDVKWIASLADPIGNNPYETYVYFLQHHRKFVRQAYFHAPHFFLEKVCKVLGKLGKPTFKLMYDLNKLEQDVVKAADVIITPNEAQAKFIMYEDEIRNQKSLVVPHSYDRRFYPEASDKKNDKFTFTFIGHSDNLRSVEPFVRAVYMLKEINPEVYNNIKVRLIGNIPSKIKDMVYVYFLQDVISIEGSVDYFESLKIMQESDCLLHVDAWFNHLENGSIFFAAKIADYLGTGHKILGVTDPKCPAGQIITTCGGECCLMSPYDVAKNMVKLYYNRGEMIPEEAARYDARAVAENYDEELERRLG